MAGQIRADFATIQQLEADQMTHSGNVEGLRDQLKQQVSNALYTLDGGMGADEHATCMARAEQLIDEQIASTQQLQRSTREVHDTHHSHGQRASRVLGQGG